MLYFIFYGFVGWLMDTGFRTIRDKKFSQGSFLKIPFCSTYGLGALLLLLIQSWIIEQNILVQFVLLAVVLSAFEFIIGFLSSHVWGKRYWDYSKQPFNLFGHTDLEHAIYWGGLGVLFIHVVHPMVTAIFTF